MNCLSPVIPSEPASREFITILRDPRHMAVRDCLIFLYFFKNQIKKINNKKL